MSNTILVEEADIHLLESSVLEEGAIKSYMIKGPFMEADIENRNKRIYPHQILEPQVEAYQSIIKGNRAVGELNHPQTLEINPENIAIKVEKLNWKDKHTVFGEAKVLSTPKGMILRSLMDEGIKFGISSRGAGTLKEGVVQNDYRFICVDCVWEPSARSAMVENMVENFQTLWVLENNVLVEKQLDKLNNSKKQDSANIFKNNVYDAVFGKFL